ncbi:MAG: GNAT family N-acetyltransferase [Bacteroidales bacterium]|nr:GNAT family N-acetyltransferase [Bacteroidales bacterium]
MIDLGTIILRNWQEKDVKSLSRNANNKKIWDNLRDGFPYPYTEMAAKQWITIANQDKPLTNFAVVYKGSAIGGVGIIKQNDIFRKNAEIGYWLGEKYWNKGISTKALKAMIEYSFNTFDVIRLFAHVFESNEASIKVLTKCGFTEEACLKKSIIKNNQILDCYIYSLLKLDAFT